MKIALLGSNGFVGTNVAQELKKNEIDFFPVSRKYGYDLKKREDNIKFLEDSECTIILNCSAHVGSLNYVTEKAADVIHDNTEMILSLYESVKQVNPNIIIINPIANCVFPANATLFKEEALWDGPLHPSIFAYGLTRRFLIGISQCYSMQYDVKTINLFTPNMYGPGDSTDPNKAHALNALVSKFVKAGEEGNNLVEVWGSGNVIREWLYVKDFARIVTTIIQRADFFKEQIKNPLSIAQNFGLSIKELVDLIIKSFEFKGDVFWNKEMQDGAPKKLMDESNFKKVFPDFKFTSLDSGIKETTEYYLNQYPY